MKRTAALLMLTLLLLRPLLSVRAETALSVTRDSYGLRVSSIDLVTSINGKYTVVKQTRTSGRIADTAQGADEASGEAALFLVERRGLLVV